MEYARVRTDCVFISSCVNTVNSVSSSSFALLTGTEKDNQSPAGELVCAVISFSFNQACTTWTVSGFGATKAST